MLNLLGISTQSHVAGWFRLNASAARTLLGGASLAVLAACGSGAGGGGGSLYVGGAPNSACVASAHNEGCYLSQRVKCDPASGQWKLIAECPAGTTYCLESPDPASPASGRRITQCVSTAGGQDTSTGGKDTSVIDIAIVDDTSAGNDTTTGTCGDGFCSAAETASCPADCGGGPVCGNGTCESGETKANCAQDCGSTGPICGNGKCESGETKANCAQDCGSGGAVCGNGTCEAGETPQTCSKDCNLGACCANAGAECGMVTGCGNCGSCGSGFTCTQNACLEQGGGDTCLADNCPSEIAACDGNTGCVDILIYLNMSACFEENACTDAQCAQTNCGTQLQDCQNSGCVTLWECLGNCPTGDDGCVQGCVGETGGEAQYNNLVSCYETNCAP